jgi:DNA modification methylase
MINQIIHGDCFDVLKNIPDNSIDLILTDPPYGLSFMGKDWDHGVPGVQFWIEALRVAKPGAHLFAFGGTRTFHRLAVAIEDAGWEIRDTIMWVYGSGFPKSHDVSKAIDKRGGSVARFEQFRDAVRAAMKRGGVSRSQLQAALGNHMLSHYLSAGSQPAVPNLRDYRIIRDTVRLGSEFDALFADEAEREVVGKAAWKTLKEAPMVGADCSAENRSFKDITAPATPAAKEWAGWGTALKPAFEPIIVARKPFTGTVAENVLQWGTGGINIDGCRVGTSGGGGNGLDSHFDKLGNTTPLLRHSDASPNIGRWPANFIHDGSEEVVGLFPYQKSGKVKPHVIKRDKTVVDFKRGLTQKTGYFLSSEGSAARFFYCAKASKSERGEGNTHPTVKPLALMKYLITLGLPPGGIVLDPFCGSGTTALACKELGRNYICIEKELEYYQIACNRLDQPIEPIPDEPIEEPVDNSPLQLKLF